jgi:hypothetical protein
MVLADVGKDHLTAYRVGAGSELMIVSYLCKMAVIAGLSGFLNPDLPVANCPLNLRFEVALRFPIVRLFIWRLLVPDHHRHLNECTRPKLGL